MWLMETFPPAKQATLAHFPLGQLVLGAVKEITAMSDRVNTNGQHRETTIDLQFRPSGYWDSGLVIGGLVQGTQRRRMIRNAIEAGRVEELPADIFAEQFANLGRIHPAFMGGEYLPPLKRGEVTIAYVCLASTTGDTIAIRARPVGKGIAYRIVDEYPEDGPYQCSPVTSLRPLTLGQLITLIDTCQTPHEECGPGLVRPHWIYVGRSLSPEEGVEFVSIESDYYPQLAVHYAIEAQRFLAEHADDPGQDDD